jgi:hypothetical protein
VMNVASKSETYTAAVSGLSGVTVAVSPSTFTVAPGQAASYAVSFTEGTAAFGQYATGFITLTGDQGHVVRIPVVVQPVKLAAPAEVNGSGTTGTLSYDVKSGFGGTLSRTIRGIQVAGTFPHHVNGDPGCSFDTANPDAAVTAGTASVDTFTTPANARYIRFQTFQSDVSASVHDLDMFVYRTSSPTTLLASGGPDASEVVSTNSTGSLASGSTFKVYVFGCGVDAGGGDFTLFAWAGANTVTTTPSDAWTTPPPSSTVTVGQTLSETFSWSSLPAGNRYLARVTYGDPAAITATNIELSTR